MEIHRLQPRQGQLDEGLKKSQSEICCQFAVNFVDLHDMRPSNGLKPRNKMCETSFCALSAITVGHVCLYVSVSFCQHVSMCV